MNSASRLAINLLLVAIMVVPIMVPIAGCFQTNSDVSDRWQERLQTEPVVKTKLAARTSGEKFELLDSNSTGIEFENSLHNENQIPYLTNGAGVSIGDYDNDGLADIFFAGQDVEIVSIARPETYNLKTLPKRLVFLETKTSLVEQLLLTSTTMASSTSMFATI